MIDKFPLEIKIALFTLHELFGSEIIIGGSISDYLNICGEVEYFSPNDVDIVVTPDQLTQLRGYFHVREAKSVYRQNTISEHFLSIGGCYVDVFVSELSMVEQESTIYSEGMWDIRHNTTNERIKMCKKSLELPIEEFRKRKAMKKLTFYKIEENRIKINN